MKKIPTPEELRALLRYEPETGKLFWLPRPREMFKTKRSFSTWNARHANQEAFTAVNDQGYLTGSIHYRTHKAHRVAWALYHSEWPPEEIDHVNGVRDDNRIENMRAVSKSVNMRNQRMSPRNTSGVNGVCWNRQRSKWQAYINLDGKIKYLGLFDSLSGAIAARRAAEVGEGYTERHGKIAA